MTVDMNLLKGLLLQMVQVIDQGTEAPAEVPVKKKRGRPPKSKIVQEILDKGAQEPIEEGVHRIGAKPKEAPSRKPTVGKNLFDPNDPAYRRCPEEGSEAWSKLKDGGVIKSQRREQYVSCTCAECSKKHDVLRELARQEWVCDDCLIKRIPR